MLSGIFSEVVQGLGTAPLIQETLKPQQRDAARLAKQQSAAAKKQVLDAVGKTSCDDIKKKFSNPEFFEGTRPIQEGNGKTALAGTAPGDAGVDITNIPGFGNWSSVATATRK